MTNPKRTVLLTGFGPFPGVETNASGELVRRLARAARKRHPGLSVHSAVLPVEWQAAPRRLEHLIARHKPDIALHFGVSHRARGFVIETLAANDAIGTPDAAGEAAIGPELDPGGPRSRRVTLPAARIAKRLVKAGHPATLSNDAGRYLCNALLYHALTYAGGHGVPKLVGFIHLPETIADAGAPSVKHPLTWTMALDGALDILMECLAQD